jgi:hypothetical protein
MNRTLEQIAAIAPGAAAAEKPSTARRWLDKLRNPMTEAVRGALASATRTSPAIERDRLEPDDPEEPAQLPRRSAIVLTVIGLSGPAG